MAMLGDLLAAAKREAGAFHRWVAARDSELAGRIEQAAAASGMSTAGWTRAAVADFARFASEEDWATLTSSLRDSEDPGSICLLAMAHWRLSVTSCAHHSHSHSPEGAAHERPVERQAV